MNLILLFAYLGNFKEDFWIIDKDIYVYNTVFYYNLKNPVNEFVFSSITKSYIESGKSIYYYKESFNSNS